MVTTDSVRGAGFDGPLFADPEGGIWSGRLNALTYRHLGRRALYSVDGLVTCIGRDARSLLLLLLRSRLRHARGLPRPGWQT